MSAVTPTANKVIAVAVKEVGVKEGRNNLTKYAPAVPTLEWAQNQPWCATFVAWCARKAGVGHLYPVTASCDVAANWFRNQGRFSEYPANGAQIFFGTPADLTHTGLVTRYDGTYVYTIEGNASGKVHSVNGDGVYEKRHERRASRIVGYGYPKFPEGIMTADPKYKNQLPKASKPAAPAKPAPVKPAPAKPAPKPAKPAKPLPPTNVSEARALLAKAVQVAVKDGNKPRETQLRKALALLPPR